MHATYAVAYLDAAHTLLGKRAKNTDPDPLTLVLSKRQQAAAQHIHTQCPNVL